MLPVRKRHNRYTILLSGMQGLSEENMPYLIVNDIELTRRCMMNGAMCLLIVTCLPLTVMNRVIADETVPQLAERFTITAYCPCKICCGKHADGYTATGKKLHDGFVKHGKFWYRAIATDPKVIPMYTILIIDKVGFCIAVDTGSAIKGRKIDVCMSEHKEARRWGVKKKMVWVWMGSR